MANISTFLIVLVIVVVGTGVGVLLYFFYERPLQEQAVILEHNLSIAALDAHSNAKLEANFTVVANGGESRGKTSTQGYVLQTITTNQSFDVFVRRPGFYTEHLAYPYANDQPTAFRVEAMMYPIGNLSITSHGEFGLDNPILLDFRSTGLVKNLMVCLRWTPNLITVSLENESVTAPPARLTNKVDKCYALNATLKAGDYLQLPVNYKPYREITGSDEIKILVLYGDDLDASGIKFQDEHGMPVVKNDSIFIISPPTE